MKLSVAPQWPNGSRPDDKQVGRTAEHPEKPAQRDLAPGEPPPHPSPASLRGLDWFVFFVANVQTGFGPFISVYLTAMAWTQVEIGIVLSIGSLVSLLGQMPGGRSEEHTSELQSHVNLVCRLLLE